MRAESADGGRIGVVRVDFAIDADLPHPAGDQLGVLGPEVEDQDAVEMNVAGGHGVSPLPWGKAGMAVKGAAFNRPGNWALPW